MKLQGKLTTIKKENAAKRSPEIIAALLQEIEDLVQSGITEKVIKTGEALPEFTLSDVEGDIISSQNLLAKGPLAISFYRGIW